MNTGDQLLAAIADSPANSAAWLVYADWLDENGQPAEAAAWRWIAQTGRCPSKTPNQEGWHWSIGDEWKSCPSAIPKHLFNEVYRLNKRNYFEPDLFKNLCWLAEAVAKLGVPE